MKPVMTVLYSILILVLGGSAGAIADKGVPDPQDIKKLKMISFVPPEEAPDFSLQNLRGETVELNAYRGRPVMLYFWATW